MRLAVLRDVNARVRNHPKSVMAFGKLMNDAKFVALLFEARHCSKAMRR